MPLMQTINTNLIHTIMKKLLIGLIAFGLTAQTFAQVPAHDQLSEIYLVATNYKYLDEVTAFDTDIDIQQMQREIATYDIKKSGIYKDEYDSYSVSFFIPNGKILASYDKDGTLIRTAERFKHTNLPEAVMVAITTRFPQWTIAKDIYLVNYHEKAGVRRRYKIMLENGDQHVKIKLDHYGNFL